ncbi:MAG TPA: tRNA epoxyqueuosine(34) reductase QueG [Acidobacteriaceae bacterium]|jgi:epoxyqueuosine reductase
MPIFDLSPDELTCLATAEDFDLAGIAALEEQGSDSAEDDPGRYLEQWIAAGHAGEMEYLKRRNEQGELLRSQVRAAIPWARSVIVCAASYNAPGPLSIDPAPSTVGWIARYAWAGKQDATGELRPADYHDTLLARLRSLETVLHNRIGEAFESRSYVDTGPLIERDLARQAGIGWTAKNTCTLNQQLGSMFFLGCIVTSLHVAPASRPTPAADRCGTCRRCIEACPTDALIAPGQMDASRCIAYLTIEKRGPIPAELRAPIGRQVFGCDICQEVCPWNVKSRTRKTAVADLTRPELINPALEWLASLTPEEFNHQFRGSPVRHTKRSGLLRNVVIAMGNSGDRDFLPQLEAWAAAEADDPVLAEAAGWAIERLIESQQR